MFVCEGDESTVLSGLSAILVQGTATLQGSALLESLL